MEEGLTHRDALGTLKHTEPKPLRPWYSFCAAVSAVVYSARCDRTPQFSAKATSSTTSTLFLLHSITALTLWYNLCTFVSGVVLYARYGQITAKITRSIFRYLELFLACKILVLLTCGESFALIKCAYLHHSPQRPDRRILLAHASLCFSKFIVICILFFVSWSDDCLALSSLVSQKLSF